jgi:glyoxylate reductase
MSSPIHHRPRVVVTGARVSEEYLRRLREIGLEVVNPTEHLVEDALVAALTGAQAYLLAGDEIATREVLARCGELRVLAFLGTGHGSFIDIDAATEFGIAVTNTPGANTTSVAELTVAHLLNARRRLTELSNLTKKGEFPRTVTMDLHGSTVGVVGMGAIGSAVTRILVDAFGARVVYHSRRHKPEVGAERVGFDQLLAVSDVVVLAAATTPETIGLVGTEQLIRMGPEAILINTARAVLVDGHALSRALREDVIATAAFDGYYVEPVPKPERDEYGLLSLPDAKFTLTPHTGALTASANNRMSAMAVASLRSFFATGHDQFVVNPEYRASRSTSPSARGRWRRLAADHANR